MSRLGYPRCPEIGVDVAGQHVLGLHVPQGLGVAGVGRAGGFGGGELGPHVAGEIGVGGLPGFRFRVVEDQVAQLGDDLLLGLAVERGDEGQIDRARAGRGRRAALPRRWRPCVTGGFLPTTSFCMMAALAALPVTSSYSSSDMTSMASGSSRNFTRLGMRRMTRAVGGFAEGGLVDRAVGGGEAVIGPVQFAAGVVAVRLGPAFVLRLQDAAGAVAQADQGGQALAGHACRRR